MSPPDFVLEQITGKIFKLIGDPDDLADHLLSKGYTHLRLTRGDPGWEYRLLSPQGAEIRIYDDWLRLVRVKEDAFFHVKALVRGQHNGKA
jgi:hypothetical protein